MWLLKMVQGMFSNGIGGVMICVLSSSAADRGFDWLAQNQDNVSEWSGMSSH